MHFTFNKMDFVVYRSRSHISLYIIELQAASIFQSVLDEKSAINVNVNEWRQIV